MATLLYGLAEATLWSGLLIVFVFLIRKPVVRYFGAKWGYALWLLPALKMMILVTPQTQLSLLPSWQTILYNFNMQQGVFALLQNKKPLTASEALFKQIEADNTARIEAIKTAVMQEGRSAFPANRISEQSLLASGSPSSDPVGGWPVFSKIDGMTILFFAWLAGFMVMGLITVGGHARLQKQLQREKRKPSPEMIWLLEQLARKMGVKFRGEVLVSARIQAPAVTGWLHPKLVLPLRFAEFYSKQEMEFMLSHELVHLQRKDYLFITWALLLKCIYWFNPLVYLAYPLFRLDQELACDQLVLTSVAPQERKSYGLTILKTISQPEMMFENFQAGCFWFTFSQMKERIAMINHHRNSKGRSMLALISMIVLGFTALTFAASDMVKDPTTGKMVTAPEYGGTLTYPYKLFGETTDPSITGHYAGWQITAVNEKLSKGDWGAPRDEVSFTGWYVPISGFKGHLAESWEQPDDRTLIVKIKPGVHWHDKPPVSGREFTAEDVAFTYRRHAGLLDFEPVFVAEVESYPWESIEALDRYTVEFKLTEPRAGLARAILGQANIWILPPEVIEQHGDYADWRNVVGTGPFMLTDYVEGVSMTRTRNPNYHDFDEKYPENRLPYVDELKGLFMAEEATRLAAFRTGQVDMIHVAGGGTEIKTFEMIESVLRTNPDTQVGPYFLRALGQIGLNIRRPPFDDIRVRKAMQMAIDREAVNESYYGGYALWKPQGMFGNATGPYFLPFDEWPKELQDQYRYDPEKAEQLLDEAGYPRGADGVRFRVTHEHRDVIDLGLAEIVVGYFKEIGVEVEINVMDTTTWVNRRVNEVYEMTTGDLGFDSPPELIIGFARFLATTQEPHNWNEWLGGIPNATLTRLYNEFQTATREAELIRIAKEYDQYVISQHFQVWTGKAPGFQVAHPWVKGWNGETFVLDDAYHQVLARLWLDPDLKAEMGF